MGKITGWRKRQNRGTSQRFIQYRSVKADPFFPQINIFPSNNMWKVQYATRKTLRSLGVRKKKEDAMKIAVRFMRSHPRG